MPVDFFFFISFDSDQNFKLSVHLKTHHSTIFLSNKLLVTVLEMVLR